MAVWALLVLGVLALTAILEAEGPKVRGTLRAGPRAGYRRLSDFRSGSERDGEILSLTVPGRLEYHLVAGLLALQDLGEVVVIEDQRAVHGQNDVAGLQARLRGGAAVDNLRQAGAGVGTVALNAEITGSDGLRHLRRFTHADLGAINNSEDGFRVLAIPIEANPAQGVRRQALGYFVKRLAAVGRSVN